MKIAPNGKLIYVTVYMTYRTYKDRQLVARVRQYFNGMPSYGANLLKGHPVINIGQAMEHCWRQLCDKTNRIDFEFEPMIGLVPVTWTETNHQVAEVLAEKYLNGELNENEENEATVSRVSHRRG